MSRAVNNLGRGAPGVESPGAGWGAGGNASKPSPGAPRLYIVPTSITDANAFVRREHRHHAPVLSALFAVAVAIEGGDVVGVAIVGRPVARAMNDGWTAEVTRLATDGTKNACSMLYAAAWRAARALGYVRLITYTLASEPGTSLRAAGWREIARVRAKSWHTPSRPRVDRAPLQAKLRWEVVA